MRSTLTRTEFTTQGTRSSLFVLTTGSGKFHAKTDAPSTSQDQDADTAQQVDAPCMIWTPTQQIARLTVSAATQGFMLSLPDTVVGQSMPTGTISAHVRRAVSSQAITPNLPEAAMVKMQNLFDQIEGELFNIAPGAQTAIHYSVSLLLIEIWRASSAPHADFDTLPHQIVDEFLHLVEVHLYNHLTVKDYAQRIGITRDRLNSAVRRSISASPHQHVQSRLMQDAKTLLLNSNLSVAEIAYKIGFNDAAYFNRFFQRHVDMAPRRFRLAHGTVRKRVSREPSFSSWP